MARAAKAVDAYSGSTRVACSIIDSKGKTVYGSCSKHKCCLLARKAMELSKSDKMCDHVHLYGSYQSERFGGKYVFYCPIGLLHWVSPIIIDNAVKGALLAGPVHMLDPDEFLIDDFFHSHNISKEDIKQIKETLKDIPVLKPDLVNNLSELLAMTAAYVSNMRPGDFFERSSKVQQQSDISEYIHHMKEMEDSKNRQYPFEKEKELLKLIALGDKKGSQKILNEIFGHIFFASGGDFKVIKARVLELLVLLSRAAMEGGADAEQIFGLNYVYLNEIHEFNTLEEITYWLSNIMNRFTDCVFLLAGVKHVDVIYKAIEYIKRNYMNKVTLEEVASQVYLSPAYFSKIFKEEMNQTFNSYLNKVKINMSKKLLLDDSFTLVEISNCVGYEDQSYFSKVFKKIVGVSPGKYRKTRGNVLKLDLEPWR